MDNSEDMMEMLEKFEKMQKMMGFMEQIKQMKNVAKAYEAQGQGGKEGDWKCAMLKAVRPHMNAYKQNQIDIMLHMVALQESMGALQRHRR